MSSWRALQRVLRVRRGVPAFFGSSVQAASRSPEGPQQAVRETFHRGAGALRGFATATGEAPSMTKEAAKVLERPIWQWALAGTALGGLVYWYEQRSATGQASGDTVPLKPIEEVKGASAGNNTLAVPDFTLKSAQGGEVGRSSIKDEFCLLAFHPETDSKGRLNKLADVVRHSDRKSNMQFMKVLYLGDEAAIQEAQPYSDNQKTHLRVEALYGPEVSKVRSSADKFAIDLGSKAPELYLISPEGKWGVVYDKHANVADVSDSIARIIINYSRQHPQWHYPKATKARVA